MVVDKDTGEILSFLPQFVEEDSPRWVVNCANNEDIKDMFPKEARGRVLWTNWSQDILRESLPPEMRNYYEVACSMIAARNYLISSVKEMASFLGVGDKFAYRLIECWVEAGLLRMLIKDHVHRGRHLFIFNPTIVWKGYVHKGASDNTDLLEFGSTYRFSYEHRKSVDEWVASYFTGTYEGVPLSEE